VKYPDLPFAMRPVTHIKELPVPKLPENMTLSSDSSDSDDDRGQQEEDNADGYPTLAASCSSFETHIFTQGDLNDLVHDLNLFKKQAELLGFRVKGGISSTKILKYVSFVITKMKSIFFFFSKK
jgi:hypothetical protein